MTQQEVSPGGVQERRVDAQLVGICKTQLNEEDRGG